MRTADQIERDVREGRDPALAKQRAKDAWLAGKQAFERGDYQAMYAKVEEVSYWKARCPQPPMDITTLDDRERRLIGGGQAVLPADGRMVSA